MLENTSNYLNEVESHKFSKDSISVELWNAVNTAISTKRPELLATLAGYRLSADNSDINFLTNLVQSLLFDLVQSDLERADLETTFTLITQTLHTIQETFNASLSALEHYID